MNHVKEAIKRVHETSERKRSHVLYTSEILRTDRAILIRHRWLEEIIRGWYLLVRPDLPVGDSTAWYASFWEFLRYYLQHHYGQNYCLSAECSLDFHVANSVIPKQVIAMSLKGGGNPLQLPQDLSLLVYAISELPEERIEVRGLQVMSLSYALCKVTPTYFQVSPQEAELTLRVIPSTSDLLRILIQYNFKNAAERIVGAYRALGDSKRADELKEGLLDAGFSLVEKNPFKPDAIHVSELRYKSPYVGRIHTMWDRFRQVIIDNFPSPPGIPKNKKEYLNQVAGKYSQDAYNSLSIEGYHVNKELIEQVMQAKWSPDDNPKDREQRDVLAARGYYEAHLAVKSSLEKILKGDSPGEIAENELSKWYQKLFLPFVQAGILSAHELYGYRRHQVYIRQSRHTPPAKEYLGELMEALFQRLKAEEHAGVRAVLGHFIFVYIHPYMDGNGRIGRFLMNVMLASGGYPWTIIQVSNRREYIAALEAVSVDGDILPFTKFLATELSIS